MTKAKKPILVTVTIDGMEVDIKDKDHGWISGAFGDYLFWAKICNDGTIYGIDEGRVYKLNIRRIRGSVQECIVHYERGWDIKPRARYRGVYKKILCALDEVPPWPVTDM